MTDTTTLNTDYVDLDLIVAESIVVTIASDTITLTREEAEKIEAAVNWSRVIIKFHVKPCRCVSIDDAVKSAFDIYKDTHESLAILNSKLKE